MKSIPETAQNDTTPEARHRRRASPLTSLSMNVDGWTDRIAETLDQIDVALHEAEMHTSDPREEPGKSIIAAQRLSGEVRRYIAGIRGNLP